MVDITRKPTTLRHAIAEATVAVSMQETIDAVLQKRVPKGDVFEMAKTAGLFAVKKTADIIPDCHPLPVEYTAVRYAVEGLEIRIEVEVKTIYRTGVEVEAMHGASVVALTMYDMLKPIDKQIEIRNIRLQEKKGGKSDYKGRHHAHLKAMVVVCSDSVSKGKKEDTGGLRIQERLREYGLGEIQYQIIPDEIAEVQRLVMEVSAAGTDLLIFTGGTGLSPRDVTPEAIRPLLDREIPGISEAARSYGQDRTPYSMLSRSLAGVRGKTLILTLPGSKGGVEDTMDALFPQVLHVFQVMQAFRHD